MSTDERSPVRPKGKVGRPKGKVVTFDPTCIPIAKRLCEMGFTMPELARALGISTPTVFKWMAQNPDFAEAVKLGKEPADDRVEQSLYQLACGYEYKSEEIKVVNGAIVRVPIMVHVSPSVSACTKWLHNRRRDTWQDRVHVDLKTNDEPVSRLDIARRILFDMEQAERAKEAH